MTQPLSPRASRSFLVSAVTALLVWSLAAPPRPAAAADLGSAQLAVAGTRLVVSPESQTVPYDTPTVVETTLAGYDPAGGQLPADLRVLGDLTGPEIDGILTLETVPNEPFRIPRLGLKGEYRLDNIRLVQGGALLGFAEPRSAAIQVTQVLITRVTSRALTLDEIRSYGIVFDEDNFHAFNFTFGFAVDGETVDYNVPVVYDRVNRLATFVGLERGTEQVLHPRFTPPQVTPFNLEIERTSEEIASGGCTDIFNGCAERAEVPLPGVILFPTDVSLLNQFFSVVLMVQNGAPAGDPLVLRDLTARLSLPPGLRLAETEPPTYLGVPVPVRVPGADGQLGTADDLSFLIAQATGQAEALVEGLTEGTHVVQFDLAGVLEGLPEGPRPIRGTARGAVLVRDPTLGVTITHPNVVRSDEEYSLLLTVSNTGNVPANLVTFAFDLAGLSGVTVVGETEKTVDSLAPGESELVELRLRSNRTGRVVAAAARVGGHLTPRFELTAGVGENGIPLSPTAIVLPRSTDNLPQDLVRNALALVGLGFSLATAPPTLLTTDLPQVSRLAVDERIFDLAQAGHHVTLGEDLFDSAAILAAEWNGARDGDWEWDRLRRTTEKGANVSASLGSIFAAEAGVTSPRAAFERFARTTAYLPEMQAVLAAGAGAEVEVASLTSGKVVAKPGLDLQRQRDLPFADLYDLGGGEMALLAVPEAGGYEARLRLPAGGSCDLALLVPDAAGQLRLASWDAVSLSAGGLATATFRATDTDFQLHLDAEGDGVFETQVPATVTVLTPRPFEVTGAVQSAAADPTGHVVDVFFSQEVDAAALLPADPSRFEVPGRVSNGGLTTSEAALVQGAGGRHRGSRIVRVVLDNPLSPYADNQLTVRDVTSVGGEVLAEQVVPLIETTVATPGGLVEGRVVGADGQAVPFAEVELVEADYCPTCIEELCRQHKTAAVRADADGRFLFDYVRQTECSDIFELRALDPVTGYHARARNRIQYVGETVQVDIVMQGRGAVRGRVLYDDGTVPAAIEVIAHNPAFGEGRRATVDAGGYYQVGEVPVGTVTLSADDGQGNFAFSTIELPRAGSVVERDLTIVRQPINLATGDVRGVVVAADGVTPAAQAYVALYVTGRLVGVERSGADGSFDFGTVPTGLAEVEAFDGETGLSGAHVDFEILPDRVTDLTLQLRADRGTVEGHVYRQTSTGTAPVAGAIVWASGTPFNTVTDAAGFYRLEGVFAGNREIRAADLDASVETRGQVSVSPGQVAVRDLYFIEAVQGGIAGEVLDYDGSPVVGATVHLAAGPVNWFYEVYTAADGRFVIPNLGPGRYAVHAVAGVDGGATSVEIRYAGDTPFATIQFRKGTIRGQVVVDDGSGQLVGVKSLIVYRTSVVRFGLVGLDVEEHTLETAADGTFTLPDALAGRYVLTASNPFYGSKTVRGEIIQHGQVDEHTLEFGTSGEIRGVLYDHDGVTPAVGATVHLRHPSFSAYDVTTDAEGRFLFALVPPSTHSFAIEAEYQDGAIFRRAQIWVQLTRSGQELDVEMVLGRQGSVVGWVEDADAVRVPGAVVTLTEHQYPHRSLVANADAEGQFRFDNIFLGKVSVSAQAPALGGLGGRVIDELTAEGQELFLIVPLEEVGEVAGRVLSPVDGSPVAGAEVKLYRYSLVERTTTDAEGAFRFRLLPLATYEVRAYDPATGRNGRASGLTLSQNNQVVEAEVVLEARGEVDGTLREPLTELPIPGATVKLDTGSIVRFSTYSSTDGVGLFEFFGIPEGSFDVSAQEPQGRRKAQGEGAITYEGERVTVDLYLEASGSVVGTVLSPDGAPAGPFAQPNVRVIQDGQVLGASLEPDYRFPGIIAGRRFYLEAEEVGGPHRGKASGVLETQGEELQLDVQMVPIGSVTVTVEDSFGNPVSGADVTLKANGFYGNKTLAGGTGADHQVTFEEVGAGELSAYVRDPATGLKGSVAGTLALDGEVVELLVVLEDSGEVQGVVLAADGVTPAADALVVIETNYRTLRTFTDAAGAFTFSAVPLGAFTATFQESYGPGTRVVDGVLSTNGEVLDLGTVVLDDRDPQVLAVSPVAGASDLPVSTVVEVELSEPIDTSRMHSSNVQLRKVSGPGVAVAWSWSADRTRLTLTPTSPLASHTLYEIVVYYLIDDARRESRPNLRSSLATADVLPPAVIDVQPVAGTVGVPVDTQPRVTFSEAVDAASLSGTALQLTDVTAGTGVSTTFSLSASEREVVLTPVAGLVPERQYRLTVQGVLDHSGNPMAAPFVTDFWSVDVTAPTITPVAPAAGSQVTAGDPVAMEVEVTDNRGVGSVTFELGGRTATVDAAPYTATLPAPRVAAASDVSLTVEAVDLEGNVGTASWPLHVLPRANAQAPTVTLAPCLEAGDLVVAGVAQPVGFTASDDELVERYSLLVDGAEVETVFSDNAQTVAPTLSWTPTAALAAGSTHQVGVRVTDFAGNQSEAVTTLQVASAPVLVGDHNLYGTAHDGQSLVLAGGVFSLQSALVVPDLTLLAGARLALGNAEEVDLQVAGTLRLQCGSTIDVSGESDATPAGVVGSGSWAGGSHGGRGGYTYPTNVSGEAYDSVYVPSLPGAVGGGAGGGVFGRGGGLVRISAQILALDGALLARGEGTAASKTGGAGGSVLVEAGTLRGDGAIDVSGGDATQGECFNTYGSSELYAHGGGGGGRVGLHVGALEGFDPALQVQAVGGTHIACGTYPAGRAAPGTIYVKTAADAYGSLLVDTASGLATFPTGLAELAPGAVGGLEAAGGDAWLTGAGPFPVRWLGVWVELLDASGVSLGAYRVDALDASGRALLAGAGGVTGAASYVGEYRFDAVELRNGAQLEALGPVVVGSLTLSDGASVAGEVEVADLTVSGTGVSLGDVTATTLTVAGDDVSVGEVTAATVTVTGTGVSLGDVTASNLTVTAGSTVRADGDGDWVLDVAGTLRVEAGAVVEADALGYSGRVYLDDRWYGQAPDGVLGSEYWAGGSHGGQGGHTATNAPPGETFDSVYAPALGGGAGGDGSPSWEGGGSGGGVVRVTAGVLELEGTLRAQGEAGAEKETGGAGGTVMLTAGTLRGAGEIDVSGGDAFQDFCTSLYGGGEEAYGGGGGGRVGLYVGLLDGFDPAAQVRARGGSQIACEGHPAALAAPGTVYVAPAGPGHGKLIVDAGTGPATFPTRLPELAGGGVASLEVAGADAWLAAAEAFPLRWLGTWVQLLDGAGGELGSFEATALDASGRLLLVGAGAVVGAATYAGEYRFDEVRLLNGAWLDSPSPLVLAQTDLTAGTGLTGQVEVADLTVSGSGVVVGDLAVSNLTVAAGAGVTMGDVTVNGMTVGAGAQVYADGVGDWELSVAGTLRVETGAVLDASALGYSGRVLIGSYWHGQAPAGVVGSNPFAGGSYGGVGAFTYPSYPSGETYGSVYEPGLGGAAGGGGDPSYEAGGDGGGVVRIAAGVLELEGTVRARGEDGEAKETGGAGGTVVLEVGTLRGAGSIDVSGGEGTTEKCISVSSQLYHYGGGGGGRVALSADFVEGFDPATQVTLAGGAHIACGTHPAGQAAPGTAYVSTPAGTWGDLYVLQQGTGGTLTRTVLPTVGAGILGTAETSAEVAGAVWITPQDPATQFSLGVVGMWVQVGGSAYRVLDQTGDRRSLLLEGADGLVAPGDSYDGLYRFDQVTVHGGATLEFLDPYEVASFDVDAASTLLGADREAPTISALVPADGAVFLEGQSLTISAQVTDNEGVRDVTFTFDGATFVDDASPYEWPVTLPRPVVTTAYPVDVEAADIWGNTSTLSHTITVEADVQAPTITSALPADGTLYTSGNTIAISAEVTDNDAVRDVTFTFDGATFVDSVPPYAWSVVAPTPLSTTDYSIHYEAVDVAGNVATLTRTVTVQPSSDPVPPTVALGACPADGDYFAPGVDVTLSFTASDNDLIASYSLVVDGVEEQRVENVNAAGVDTSLVWTPPASPVAGHGYVVAVEVRDFAGNVASASIVMPAAEVALTGDQNLDATLDGSTVSLGPGTFTVLEPLHLSALAITAGAVVTGADGVRITTDGALRVQCGGLIDVTGQGYAGGAVDGAPGEAPVGVTPSAIDAGGSHGGPGSLGGAFSGPVGEVYDSVHLPALAGGGGSLRTATGGRQGGPGGGVVDLVVGELVLEGDILANGVQANASGYGNGDSSGAGGTVIIDAGVVRGVGTIGAHGRKYRNYYSYPGGSGGGGRVALYVDSFVGFDWESQVNAAGGTYFDKYWNPLGYAGPGTVYVWQPGMVYGELKVDNQLESDGTPRASTTELPALGTGSVLAFEASGSDAWVTGGSAFRTRWLGAWMVLEDGSGAELGAFQVVELDAGGRVRLAGAGAVTAAASYRGEYRFDRLLVKNGVALQAHDRLVVDQLELDTGGEVQADEAVVATTLETWGAVAAPSQLEATDVVLRSGSVVKSVTEGLYWNVSGTLTVESGAQLDVTGQGYAGGAVDGSPGEAPAGVTPSSPDAGGSHGGPGVLGGDYAGPVGEVYDSVYLPELGGGGGSLRSASGGRRGGAGGGGVSLVVGELALEGEIRAMGAEASSGAYGNGDCSGGGGTVVIDAGVVRGAGLILAHGGRYRRYYSYGCGSGGGGRVALYVDSFVGFDWVSQARSVGGSYYDKYWYPLGWGGPGTVYLYQPGMTYGELKVDNGLHSDGTPRSAATELPTLGTGSVLTFEASGVDAWVTGGSTFRTRWLGAWMVLEDGSGAELGAFQVVEVDGAGRVRLAGAGAVTAAASYRGEYRFDRLLVKNGAALQAHDRLVVGQLELDTDGEVQADEPVVATTLETWGSVAAPSELEATSVVVHNGSVVKSVTNGLYWNVSGTLTVESGASLDVTGQGYAGATVAGASGEVPPGVAPSAVDAGGSHGGPGVLGGEEAGPVGEVYDSVYFPELAGGGGSLRSASGGRYGGPGGGVVDLVVGELVLDGKIWALGPETRADQKYDGDSTGAGGTVVIDAGTVRGSGEINARGGWYKRYYSTSGGGSGGGGRIALFVDSFVGFDWKTQVKAHGSAVYASNWTRLAYAGPGTVYLYQPGMTYGELKVDNLLESNGTPRASTTELPTLGSGVVGVTEVDGGDPADLWIEPQDPAAEFALGVVGMWVRADGLDYRVLAQSPDRRRVLLEGAAGIVDVGSTYAGVYKFDTVILRGGTTLVIPDLEEVGVWDIAESSSVQ